MKRYSWYSTALFLENTAGNLQGSQYAILFFKGVTCTIQCHERSTKTGGAPSVLDPHPHPPYLTQSCALCSFFWECAIGAEKALFRAAVVQNGEIGVSILSSAPLTPTLKLWKTLGKPSNWSGAIHLCLFGRPLLHMTTSPTLWRTRSFPCQRKRENKGYIPRCGPLVVIFSSKPLQVWNLLFENGQIYRW